MRAAALVLPLLFAPLGSAEPSFFVAPMYGASFGGDFETTQRDDQGVRQDVGSLKLDNDSHVGLMVGMETKDPGSVYLLYSKQQTRFKEGALAPSSGVNVDVSYYHLGGTLYFPNGDFHPYVTASLGATHLQPSGDFSSDLALSLGLALGARYMPLTNLGLYAELRGYYTAYGSSAEMVCPDDDGDCRFRIETNGFYQTQANVGLVVRF